MTTANIVNISISLATLAPSRASFGVPLCLAHHTHNADLYRDYSSLSEMITDSFAVNDQGYKLAAAVFAQDPRPPVVRVARLPTPGTNWTATLDLTGIVAGQSVQFTLVKADGSELVVDEAFDTSATATGDAVALLDATITNSSGVLTFDSGSPGVRMYVTAITGFGDYIDTTADWAYDTALTALLNADAGFYGIAIDVNSSTNVTDVATWTLANNRVFIASPQVTDPADWATPAAAMRTATNTRSASMMTADDPEGYGGAAWLGRMLAKDPGSATWAFKTLTGVTTDPWTTSQQATLDTNNSNYYVTLKGVPITYPGKAHSGEWLDVTRGVDWFEDGLATRLLALQVNNDKVPYTDAGISMVANEVRGMLAEAEAAGLVDAGWTVTTPTAASATTLNRTARTLVGVEFEARLAGAVHLITISGRITA